VQEIGKMKAFYKDVLKLGEPVVDSNFWIEFRVCGNGVLILEQSGNVVKSKVKHGQSWLMPVADFNATVAHYKEMEVWQVRPPVEVPGYRTATYADPEGNTFTIYAPRDSD
jgi:predicted enzyme related to lactoylglutathione lyase